MLENHTPAEILRKVLIDAGEVSLPSQNDVWPMFVSGLDSSPNDALAIYDTVGTEDGSIQPTGETKRHPGWQVRCRSVDYRTAYRKLAKIANFFDTLAQVALTLDADQYTLHSVYQSSNIVHLVVRDEQAREHFTFNGTVAIT